MIKTTYGLISGPAYSGDDLIVSCLSMYGEWGYIETLLASTLTKDGEHFWDIGAHLGTFTLGLSMHTCPGFVLAVDANSEVFDPLNNNLVNNLKVEFRTVLTAVASCAGHGSVHVEDPSNHGAARFFPKRSGELPSASIVSAVTLKELRARYGDYDFLKLDIEGGEVEALQGDTDFINARKPVIWAECNQNRHGFNLLDQMLALGYEPYFVAFPVIRNEMRRTLRQVIHPMAYEAALVCGTPERLKSLDIAVTSEPCILRKISNHQDLRQALWDTPRWARQEWVDLSKPELIARIGHFERGDDFKTFTYPAAAKGWAQGFAKNGTISTRSKGGSTAIAQVFWAQPAAAKYEFSERDAQVADIPTDGAIRVLSFSLPTVFGPLHVRVDPIDMPSVVSLGAIKLVNGSGDILWCWDGDLGALHNMSGMVALTASDGRSYVCVNTDPHFEISVPGGVFDYTDGFVKLIIEINAESLERGLGRLLKVVDSQNVQNPPNSLGQSIESPTDLIEHSLASSAQIIAQQRHQLNQMRIELMRAAAQLDLLKDLMIDGGDEDRL